MSKLVVNDCMPNFTFDTAYHQGMCISEAVKGKKKTIFWVLRYIGCTICRLDVQLLAEEYQKFLDKDAQIYVVMQSAPETVREDLKDANIPFEIICDTEMDIYKKLEIGTLSKLKLPLTGGMGKLMKKVKAAEKAGLKHGKYEGDEEQLPAMFIVDETRKVLYSHYGTHYGDMPTVDEALKLLD